MKTKRKELSKETIKTIIKMRQEGATQKDIATKLNVSTNKMKSILQKLIDDEIIERKRVCINIKLKNSVFDKDVPASVFINRWQLMNDEELALYFDLKPKAVKRYGDCVRQNIKILSEKYENYNPLIKLNLPEKHILKLISKYSKDEIIKQLNIEMKDFMECVEYLNYMEDEKVRKAKRKDPVVYKRIPEEKVIELHSKYDDYIAGAMLGVGHATFGQWVKILKEEGKIDKERKNSKVSL